MVNRLLRKKLWRDLRRHLGALVAIAVVVASGVATFVAMRTMVSALSDAQASYYVLSRFPQVFAHVRRAPLAIVPDLRAIPGVARLSVRAGGEVALRVPNLADAATGRIVGVHPDSPDALNRVVLRAGRVPAAEEADAVVVSEGFAQANGLAPGDTLGAVLGGRWRTLRVVGVGIAAEFAYELRPGDMLPDPQRFGVLWVGATVAERTFGLEGAWNELALTLAPGASERAVIAALDARLRDYGSFGAYGRTLHPSHRFLSEEIRQNRTFAVALPAIFIAVAAFLVHLVLGRVVVQQRDQVGTLKAFGVPTLRLTWHYVLFALAPVAAGSIVGVALGIWLAGLLAQLYMDFFRFPEIPSTLYPSVLLTAVGIGILSAVIGALGALRRILALPPAEAMRPEPPARYGPGLVEWLLGRRGAPVPRMIARGLTHRPWRTLFGALGIGLGAAVVVVGSFGFDAVEQMRGVLFGDALRADISVQFAEPVGPATLAELRAQPEVRVLEPRREVAVRIESGHRARQTALIGVDPDARLRRVVNLDGQAVAVAPGGITLSLALGRVLRVSRGDSVRVELLDGRGRQLLLPVVGLVDDISGTAGYVDASELMEIVGAGDGYTAADLAVDPEDVPALVRRLTEAPGIRSITTRAGLQRSFDETIEANFLVTLVTLVLLAGALAAATIYNAGRVTLSERARDLASLRVLGFTRGEAARILFGELATLTAIGLPIGLLLGAAFAWATVASFGTTELFRLPLVIGPRTLMAGVAVPLLAGAGSLLPLKLRVNRIDLMESLKTRE